MNLLNKKWLLWSVMLIGAIVLTSPFWIWYFIKSSEASIVILSDNKQRVAGIQWSLDQKKIVDQTGKSYSDSDVSDDFNILQTNTYELVYISAIEAGMSEEQIQLFKQYLIYKGGNAIVEHSLFDLSTDKEARYELETLTNVRWTGWKGIAYSSDTISELPNWIYSTYEKRYKEVWEPTNDGIVFVNAYNDDIVVLEGLDLIENQTILDIIATANSNESLLMKNYLDWFTVLEPTDKNEAIAMYELNISNTGKQKLETHGINIQFPAIVEHQTLTYKLQTYAGEFSKLNTNITVYNSLLQKIANRDISKSKETEPFWNIFQPFFMALINQPFEFSKNKPQLTYIQNDQYSYNTRSRIGEKYIEIYEDNQWKSLNIKGVNLGMGKPGYFPGEASITEAEYFRWFKLIGQMNANVLRVYTLQSPIFYKALYEYNLTSEEPLYIFHGAWVVEELIAKYENMFTKDLTDTFHQEIRHVIDAVYGNTIIEDVPGHAHGNYQYDVSDYLLGWIVGIEFDGEIVHDTNTKNKNIEQFTGQYINTVDGDPFEIWIAQSMEYTIQYEVSNYKKAHLISYTNWPTTDLLSHPYELDRMEDLDKIDPNLIKTTKVFLPGQFYSFHIYPYYPDFIDETYGEYRDINGNKNAYAGYIHDLKQYLDLPSIITEFGVPASRGITHYGHLGRNQGGHTEESQGYHNMNLYDDILNEGYGGGLIFTWQDEWFKRTWNTMDFDNPDRRPYWSNYQTNEQYFGLLSFESGQYETAIHLDGNVNDWEVLFIEPLYTNTNGSGLKNIYLHHDARYLYLRLDYYELDVEKINTQVYFDTLPNQGNKSLLNTNIEYTDGFEFLLDIKDKDKAELFVDSNYDVHHFFNGYKLYQFEFEEYTTTKNNGIYHPIKLILSSDYEAVTIDGKQLYRPYAEVVTGKLKWGNSNPKSNEYDSLADYFIHDEKGIIEIRLPWLSLNFRDPSLKEVISDLYLNPEQDITGEHIEGIKLLAIHSKDKSVSMLPTINKTVVNTTDLKQYVWSNWDHPLYHERLKTSYFDIQQLYNKY